MLLLAAAHAATPSLDRLVRVLEDRVRTRADADSLLVLAEVWSRVGEARELDALDAWIRAYDTCFDTPGCDRDALRPDLGAADAARRNATVRYRQLLRDYPDDPRMDLAAYGLGHAWLSLRQPDLADAAFTWLVARHPASALSEDGWVLVGEHAFEAWQADWAVYAYGQAVARGGVLAGWAQYKQAWSRFRLGDYAGAIDTMRAAASRPDRMMQDEALRDLVVFYREVGEFDDLGHGIGRRQEVALLGRMADAYAHNGMWEQALQLHRRLMYAAPERRAEYEAKILEAYLVQGRVFDAMTEVDRVLRWPREEQLQLGHALEHGVREAAFFLHKRARATGDRAGITQALALYERHRADWPDAEHAEEIAWGYAVALDDLGRPAARAAYAAMNPVGRYGRMAAEALEGR